MMKNKISVIKKNDWVFICIQDNHKSLDGWFVWFLIKMVLEKTNQKWLATYHHTLTFILLPMITCGITNSIKSNIALSLGLVGALSIVRFRNQSKILLNCVISLISWHNSYGWYIFCNLFWNNCSYYHYICLFCR